MKKNPRFIYLLFFASLAISLACPFSSADVLTLKNGRSLEGEILEEGDATVILRTKIGRAIFKRSDVASEEHKELPEGFFAEKAEDKVSEKPQATVTPIPLKAEGYGEANSGKYNLSVSAEMRKLYNGDAILVKYKTNLPQKAVLFLQVKKLNQVIVARKHAVEGASFAIRFGPFGGKRFASGIYVVEVSCIASRQESEEIKKKLEGIGDIVATAEIRIGSTDETEEVTHKHKKELISDLKTLEALYSKVNLEYESQKKEFDKSKWDSFADDFTGSLNKIRDFDHNYRINSIVMDYSAQENIKISIVDNLERLLLRYTEALYRANNIEFTVPSSIDNRDPSAINISLKNFIASIRGFVEESEKGTEQK